MPDSVSIIMNKNLRCCCLTAAAVVGLIQVASAADIAGKITLTGKPPAEVAIPLDQSCGKLNTGPATTHHYLVGSGGELGDVFVYIKEGAKPAGAPAAEAKVLDQVGCAYTPFIFGLQTKQKLVIRNSDPGILHNVHVLPDGKSGNKESNQAQLKGQDLNKTFDSPEVFLHFKCDVHNWMKARICVFEHPFFAVTAADGTYEIKLPAGSYTISTWQEMQPSKKVVASAPVKVTVLPTSPAKRISRTR